MIDTEMQKRTHRTIKNSKLEYKKINNLNNSINECLLDLFYEQMIKCKML